MQAPRQVAILPSRGIGDGLLMMIVAENFHQHGFKTVVWHNGLSPLQSWFLHPVIKPKTAPFEENDFEKVIVQNDNSAEVKHLIHLRNHGKLPQLTVLYPTYQFYKHGKLHPNDIVFDPHLSMAENLYRASLHLLKEPVGRGNGIQPEAGLLFKKHPKRLLIHPFSHEAFKNWSLHKFIALFHKLKKKGFEPVFIMEECSEKLLHHLQSLNIPCIFGKSLSDIACLIYESRGVIGNDSFACHLASNLGIPSLVVGDCPKRLALWRPGWHFSAIVTPAKPFLKWGFFKKQWQRFIYPHKVLRRAEKIFSVL